MSEEQKDQNAGATTTEAKSAEISAAAVGRLMGLATAAEMRVIESKLDLLTQKLAGMAAKIEKFSQVIGNAPTGADLERIDVQVGSIKAILREFVQTQDDGKETQ